MKIYKVWRVDEIDYGEYDSMVVVAKNEEEAKRMHPDEAAKEIFPEHERRLREFYYDDIKKQFYIILNDGEKYYYSNGCGWTNDLSNTKVEYIGKAKKGLKKGVILASYDTG